MSDDKSPKDHSWPPPPMDPFPTYQSHFPRSKKDDDQNPFIQFRRFADEQVSSFFSGFPDLFGLSSSGGSGDHWKKEVEDKMRQRQQWEEGFRKQFEQEMEEMRQQLEKSKTEAWKSMEDAWQKHSQPDEKKDHSVAATATPTPWWTRGRAAHCPALNDQEPQTNSKKCPALYDEKGQPRTELDAYNALQADENKKQVQVFQAPAQQPSKKPARPWWSAVGWDGKQRGTQSGNNSSEDRSSQSERPPPRPTTYAFWAARRMQPFENPDQTIPWLMLSPYSPIYLCNPAQSRLFKVKIQDSEGVPLQISNAKFFERWYTDIDERMASHKPWADAFEDLLSLQQTGKMLDRENWSTWRTPRTWFHDMASRGSLGNRWGFDEQGMLVKRVDETRSAEQTPAATKEDRCGRWRKNRESRRNKSQSEAVAQPEKPATEDNAIADKLTDALAPFPLFGSIISAADAIVSTVDRMVQRETQAQAGASTAPFEPDPVAAIEESNASSYSTSTASSSSWNHDSAASSSTDNKSVISTLTTSVTRTLPDGSVETKRVLKRRFADGSEESDESVELKNLPNGTATTAPAPARKDNDTQTPQAQTQSSHADELQAYRDQFHALDSQEHNQPKALYSNETKPRRDAIADYQGQLFLVEEAQKRREERERQRQQSDEEEQERKGREAMADDQAQFRLHEDDRKKREEEARQLERKGQEGRELRQREEQQQQPRQARQLRFMVPISPEASRSDSEAVVPEVSDQAQEQMQRQATENRNQEQTTSRRRGGGWFWN